MLPSFRKSISNREKNSVLMCARFMSSEKEDMERKKQEDLNAAIIAKLKACWEKTYPYCSKCKIKTALCISTRFYDRFLQEKKYHVMSAEEHHSFDVLTNKMLFILKQLFDHKEISYDKYIKALRALPNARIFKQNFYMKLDAIAWRNHVDQREDHWELYLLVANWVDSLPYLPILYEK